MMIDCHIHVKGGDVYRTENTAEEILPVLDRAGIDKAVILAMCTAPDQAIEMVVRESAKAPDRLIGFAYARPMYDRSVRDLLRDAIDRHGLRGIKIHRGETLLTPDVLGPVYALACEYRRPCLVDSGNDLNAIFEVIKAYPELPLILAHHGVPSGNVQAIDQVIEFVKPYPNVYLDTAYMPTYWKIRDAVNALGSERILFGSDGILVDPRTELAKIDVLGLTPEERANILGLNAARLLM